MSDNRVALVMGGGAGTGRATCLAFARAGYRVVVADINAEAAEKTAGLLREAQHQAAWLVADMSQSEQVARAVATAQEEFGGLHAVSNNAALGTANTPLVELSEADWDRCFATTLRGVWLCLKYQLPLIEASGGGAIVNIASVAGLRGDPLQGAYAAAKAGVINLSKTAATEYAKRGVRVNTVCPGGINSGGMAFYLDQMPADMRERVLNTHAMGRLAEPSEIADAAVYLCSEQASFITGHDLVVDGGILVRSNVMDL